jgi:hypothetical protein
VLDNPTIKIKENLIIDKLGFIVLFFNLFYYSHNVYNFFFYINCVYLICNYFYL